MKAQKFPKDTQDEIEQMFADKILAEFPSYGKFWEQFIGVDVDRLPALWPRPPKFPKEYEDAKKEDFRKKQEWFARVSYGIFCNLSGAHYQLEQYLKQIPIADRNDKESFFKAIEAVECAYLHIGNVAYGLESLWGKIRKLFTPHLEGKLETYLDCQGRGKHLSQLMDEPKDIIRDKIVHIGRHVTITTNEIHIPLTVPKEEHWSKANVSYWVPADVKLKDHITVASKACEDVYQIFIKLLSTYLQNERIEIP